ncbi:unnamed protein product, partial [Brachionus calyciflorus]
KNQVEANKKALNDWGFENQDNSQDQELEELKIKLEDLNKLLGLVNQEKDLVEKKAELDSKILSLCEEIKQNEELVIQNQNMSVQLKENLESWQKANQQLELEISNLQAQYSELDSFKNLNVDLQNKVDQLNKENELLKETNNSISNWNLNSQIPSSDANLQNKIIDLENQINFLRDEKQNNLLKIHQLNTELHDSKLVIENLSAELNQSLINLNILDDLKNEIDLLKIENEDLQKKFDLKKESVDQFKSNVNNIIKEYHQLSADPSKLHDETDNLSLMIKSNNLESKYYQMEIQNKDLIEQMELLKGEKLDLHSRIQQFEQDLILLNNQVEEGFNLNYASNDEINELIDQVSKLKQDNLKLNEENKNLNEKVCRNNDDVVLEQKNYVATIEFLTKNLNDLEICFKTSEQLKEKLQSENMALLGELDQLKNILDELRSNLFDKNEKLKNLDAQNKELSTQIATDKIDTENLENKLSNKINELESELKFAESVKGNLETELEKLKLTNTDLLDQVDSLKLDNQELSAKITELESSYENLKQIKVEAKNEPQVECKKIEEKVQESNDWSINESINLPDDLVESDARITNLQAEIIDLNEKIKKLENEKNGYFEQVKSTEANLLSLNEEMNFKVVNFEQELKQKESEIDILQEKYQEIEKTRQDLQVQNMDMLAEIDSLKLEKEELENELNNLKNDFSSKSNEQSDAAENKIKELNLKIDENNKELNELRVQNMDLLGEVDSLKLEKEQIEVELKNLVETSSEIDKLKLEKLGLNQQLNDSAIQIEDLNKQIFELNQLKAQNMDLLGEVDSLKLEKEEIQNEINNLRSIESQKTELTNEIENSNLKLQELNLLIETKDQELNELRTQNMELLGEVDAIKLEKEELNTELNNLKTDQFDNTTSLKSINDQNVNLAQQIESLLNDKQSLEEQINSYRSQIEKLQIELTDTNNELGVFAKDKENLGKEIQNLSLELNELKTLNMELLCKNDLLNLTKDDLENQLKDCKSNLVLNDDLKSKIELVNNELNDCKVHNKELLEELDSLKIEQVTNLKSSESDFTKFNLNFDSLSKENEDLNERYLSSQTQNQILTNMVMSQKNLIENLEKESKRLNGIYEKLISSQRKLICKQDKRYNDVLHSLIDSFDDLDPSNMDNKVQEIESDLNNLIQILNHIKENDSEKPLANLDLSPYSFKSIKHLISEHSNSVKGSNSNQSINEEFYNHHTPSDISPQQQNEHLGELFRQNLASSLLMVKKYDVEIQCNLYEEIDIKENSLDTSSLRLSTDFNEINSLQDLIMNYLNLIKSYKNLLAKFDAVNIDNSELRLKLRKKISTNDDISLDLEKNQEKNDQFAPDILKKQVENLKMAYQNLYALYEKNKSESFSLYNKLHDNYIKLVNTNQACMTRENFNSKLNSLRNKLKIEKTKNAELIDLSESLKNKLQQNQNLKNDDVTYRTEIEKLDTRLQAEELKNEVLKQTLRDYEIQIELSNSKINALNEQIEQKEGEFKSFKVKIDQIESGKDAVIKNLNEKNQNLLEECEVLKKQLLNLRREKLELETSVEDLKRTLKLTEKESQYNLKLDLMHIRAKLLTPSQNEPSLGPDGKPLKAILPPLSDSSSLRSSSSLTSVDTSDILNDFAIDITHIEKLVQDSDSIILEQKPLEGVQSCLKSLRDQMTELQTQVYEQARESSTWRYKLGYTCEKCEMKWEIEHQVRDSKHKLDGDDEFLESPITKQIPKCHCAKLNEIQEDDNK